MKKVPKPKSVKPVKKGVTKPPLFKKAKTNDKLKLPKNVEIDQNIVKKTKPQHIEKLEKKSKIKLVEKITSKKSIGKNGMSPNSPKNKPKKASEDITLPSNTKKKTNSDKQQNDAAPEPKRPKIVPPSKYITDEVAKKAVLALQKLAEQQKKNKIFEEEITVLAQINCIKIQSRKTTVKINLPHSTVASTGEVCLITTDLKKGRKHDHEPSVDHWEEILRNAGVTQVKTVLPMRQLRVEYDQFELKRRLLTQHDFILVDSRIHGHACHVLGKVFQKKHNMLIPVRLHEVKDIKKSIEASLNMSLLHLSDGATSSVMIGHMGMTVKQLKENIMGLVKELAKKYPGGEYNIRSLHVKLPLSLAVPLYVTLRSKKLVAAPKVHSELPKNHKTVEGELTTILGSTVKITPDGNITVIRNPDETMSDDEVEEDEEMSGEENEQKVSTNNKKQRNKKSKNKENFIEEDQDEIQEMDSESDETPALKNKKQKLNKTKNKKEIIKEEEEQEMDLENDTSDDDSAENEDSGSELDENVESGSEDNESE